jgi:hypothetical protein
MPAGTGMQTPIDPGSAQLWQAPGQAVAQQTTAQWPLKHSSSTVQKLLVLSPQAPLAHGFPFTQSASLVQKVLHWAAATSQV